MILNSVVGDLRIGPKPTSMQGSVTRA